MKTTVEPRCKNCNSMDTRRNRRHNPHDTTYLLMLGATGFWRKGGGYTVWIDEAEHFSIDEAESRIRSSAGTHDFRAVPSFLVDQFAKRTVDFQTVVYAIEGGK